MILSGTMSLDPAAHSAATDLLHDRLADLSERRREAARAVEDLLRSWHGEAAAQFREHWARWDEGAVGVLDSLAAGVTALDLARLDLTGADSARADAVAELAGRLG